MRETKFALRTCSDCGAKRATNEMKSRSVRAGGATFRSRKSITPMTMIGAAIGNKKATSAIGSWFFNTANRRGSVKTYKQVNICTTCYLKPDFSTLRGGVFSWIMFWPIKLGWPLAVSAAKVLIVTLTNPKIYTSLWAAFCNVLGLTRLGGQRASQLAREKIALRRIKSLDDQAVLSEVFKSTEFSEITNYIMMNQVAEVDGNFSKDEKRFINSSLEIGAEAMTLGKRVLADSKLSNVFVELIREKDDSDLAFAKRLLINLFSLASVDGDVDESELRILAEYAQKLGLTRTDFDKIKGKARSEAIELGVSFASDGMDSKISNALSKA